MKRPNRVLRVDCDQDRTVWYGDNEKTVVASGLGVDAFMLSKPFQAADVVQITGFRRNLHAIERFFNSHLIVGIPERKPIFVGSPLSGVKTGPTENLENMVWRAIDTTDMTNAVCWSPLSDYDYSVFAFLNAMHKDGKVTDRVLRMVKYHPAWPALTFVPRCNHEAACELLYAIGDPRWYRHPTRPGRLSRLYAWLGMTKRNAEVLSGDDVFPDRHVDRFASLCRVWTSSSVDITSIRRPREFLLRTAMQNDNRANGLLAGSKRLVRFVSEVWLCNRTDYSEMVFDVSRFFEHRMERQACLVHLAKQPRYTTIKGVDASTDV